MGDSSIDVASAMVFQSLSAIRLSGYVWFVIYSRCVRVHVALFVEYFAILTVAML